MRILDAVKTYDVSNVGYAKVCNADLLLATDPDCDRVGIAVKNKAGEYELLTGNQTGMLLDYNCSQRVKHGKMPADPVMVKTIVTMDMGEQIGKLEKQGKKDSYEESCGYLTGSYVRNKDGVDGAYMICEMFSYYATKGISLLDELYKAYGYCLNNLHNYEFDGSAGFAKNSVAPSRCSAARRSLSGWITLRVWMVCRSLTCSSPCWKITVLLWCAPPIPSRS